MAAAVQSAVFFDRLPATWPKLAAMMNDSRDDVFAYMTFQEAHRRQTATTNPLERINAETKRRGDRATRRCATPLAGRRIAAATPLHATRRTQSRQQKSDSETFRPGHAPAFPAHALVSHIVGHDLKTASVRSPKRQDGHGE